MGKVTIPKHTSDPKEIHAALQVYYEADDWLTNDLYKERLKEIIGDGEYDSSYNKKAQVATYYGLISWEDSTSRARKKITEAGKVFYESVINNDKAKMYEIIVESLEKYKYGRDNDGSRSSKSDVDPPTLFIRAILDLDYISYNEFEYLLWKLANYGGNYSETIEEISQKRLDGMVVSNEDASLKRYSDAKPLMYLTKIGFFNSIDSNISISEEVLQRYNDRLRNLKVYNIDIDIFVHEQDQEMKKENLSKLKGKNLILYGAPGTGKSFELNRRYSSNQMRVTFHPEYSYHDFVGSYRPEPLYKKEDTSNFVNEENQVFEKGEPYINYRFVPGPLTLMLESAISSLNSSNPQIYTLIIEEINRANTPAVFGDLFQLLDRENTGESTYGVTNLEILKYLKSKEIIDPNQKEIKLPNNLNLVASMNSADQGVFVMDSAFKRRWIFEYLSIDPEEAKHKDELVSYNGGKIRWADFVLECNRLLADNRINEDRHIGPYFLKQGEPSNNDIFSSKLLMYLWDDVGRTMRSKLFKNEIKTFSQLVKLYNNNQSIFLTEFEFVQTSATKTNSEGERIIDNDELKEKMNSDDLTNENKVEDELNE